MVKQWKINPPGEEQLALESMFENDEIQDHETAPTVQAKLELFKPFSDRVFISHFNKTKAKFGYGLNGNLNEKRFKKFLFLKTEFF